jgi:hypothetical protein
MKASLVLGPAFALIHLPSFLKAPVTGEQLANVAAQMVLVIPLSILLRMLIAWLYNRAAFSVLIAALLHASFNTASASEFLGRLGAGPAASFLPLAVVVVLGLLVAVGTKGRLGYGGDRVPERDASPSATRPSVESVEAPLAHQGKPRR